VLYAITRARCAKPYQVLSLARRYAGQPSLKSVSALETNGSRIPDFASVTLPIGSLDHQTSARGLARSLRRRATSPVVLVASVSGTTLTLILYWFSNSATIGVYTIVSTLVYRTTSPLGSSPWAAL